MKSDKALISLEEATASIKQQGFHPSRETALAAIAAAYNALDAARTFPEIQKITNQLEVFKIYYQKSKADFEATKALATAWLHGCARMGAWLEENVRRGRPGKNSSKRATILPDGIDKFQSIRLQRIADLDSDLETWIAGLDDAPSMAAALRWWHELHGLKKAKTPPLPDGVFDLIYADPPWRYEHIKTVINRAIENQYPTLELEEICALPVAGIANDDCLLFLWATNPKLEEAMRVIEAWGFTYRTNMVWVKDKIGMGYYARQRHELLLIAGRGNPPTPTESDRPDSVQSFPRGEHSVKPPEFYEIIEQMYPNTRRIELFQREPREGWTGWGNEINDDS